MSEFKITVTRQQTFEVERLKVQADVRYWEDATVNGVEDESGDLIPFRNGDTWEPVIDLASGAIIDWPKGVVADIHYKVCDAGEYTLLDADGDEVRRVDGYVPAILAPEGGGFGDYIIMKVNEDGHINNWSVDLEYFAS